MFTFLPGPFLVQFSGPFYLSTDIEISQNPTGAVPAKLVHLGSGFIHHEHHSYSGNSFAVKLSGVIKSDEHHEEVEIA